MIPTASLFGFALSSLTSATRRTISSRSLIPSPVWADTGTIMVSPPHSSGTRPYSIRPCITLFWSAASLSILFIATIIGISAALAWLIASTVCGITPSSAATTRIAISVDLAPLILISVKASWPGVSRKDIFLSLTFTV